MADSQDLSLRTRALNAVRSIWTWRLLEPIAVSVGRGNEPESLRARLLPNHYQYPVGSWRDAKVDGSLRFRVDVGTWHGWWLYFGLVDPSLGEFYGRLRPGMTVLDIGANIGEVSLRAGLRVGPKGRVVSFEPFPPTLEALRGNIARNPSIPVQVLPVALGSAPASARMEAPIERNPGGNRISPTGGKDVSEGQGGVSGVGASGSDHRGAEVQIRTLDEVVAELDLDRVDWIKIDTEGYEHRILDGAAATLTRFRPHVFIELSDGLLRDQGSSTRALLGWFEGHGYSVTRALGGEPVLSTGSFDRQHFDAIASPGQPPTVQTSAGPNPSAP